MEQQKNPEVEKNEQILLNEIDSDKRAAEGEDEIRKFDNIDAEHTPLEDMDEISSTDDV